VTLAPAFITALHERLALPVGAPGFGVFHDGIAPMDWGSFQRVLTDLMPGYPNRCACELGGGPDAWIFAQLYWGGHIESLRPSVAWLLINGIRFEQGGPPAILYPGGVARFKEALQDAGPPCWDAETLRGLIR
jgi:hypothetical protein